VTGIGRRGVGDKIDEWGQGATVRMHNLEGKAPFGKYAKAARAEWAEQGRRWSTGQSGLGLGQLG
jgi:hypothetical protein